MIDTGVVVESKLCTNFTGRRKAFKRMFVLGEVFFSSKYVCKTRFTDCLCFLVRRRIDGNSIETTGSLRFDLR